jgi:hypothetical protein
MGLLFKDAADEEKSGMRTREKHAFFTRLLREAADTMPQLALVADALDDERLQLSIRTELEVKKAKPGDKVILQVPVYHPFFTAVKNNGCEVVENPLKLTEDRYEIDFEDLEGKIEDNKVKVLVLCNPHNPVGRVWTKEELVRIGELCIKNNVKVISDEIHCDLVYKEYKHISFASINDDFAQISAVCTAPSKTFNLAGLQTSSIIIANTDLRKKFFDVLEDNGIWAPNIFGIEALEAAYNYGEQWLDEVIEFTILSIPFKAWVFILFSSINFSCIVTNVPTPIIATKITRVTGIKSFIEIVLTLGLLIFILFCPSIFSIILSPTLQLSLIYYISTFLSYSLYFISLSS